MIKIKNRYLISTPVKTILNRIKYETTLQGDTYLRDMRISSRTALVTCPFHKNHNERTPSCGVFLEATKDWKEGDFHCFGCGESGSLIELIAQCFNEDTAFGEEWLIERFGDTLIEQDELLPEIILDKPTVKKEYLDESILIPFDFYHPYMWKRKLSKEVVDRFRVGYDKERDAITFPVYDEKHHLVMVTARSVNTKRFWIPKNVDKPLYLLYDILEHGIDHAIITEGQIDALTAWTYGSPAVATMGCPSENQIDILNKSGLRVVITMFDNDAAGSRFVARIKKNLSKDILLLHAQLPQGTKDINDLTKEQFDYVMNHLS